MTTESAPELDGSSAAERSAELEMLAGRIGHRFADPDLLELALRHRSWCAEHGGVDSNERLEFLGDAVLGLVITEHLYAAVPDQPEGVLARHRSELVNARTLAAVAADIGLGRCVLLGRGEESTGGRSKPSILADAFEALLGAVYLDGGLAAATPVVLGLLGSLAAQVTSGAAGSDFKSRLQELVAQRFDQVPVYELDGAGPDHDKWFQATVSVAGVVVGSGGGRSKKQAEQAAAEQAWEQMAVANAVDDEIVNGDGDA